MPAKRHDQGEEVRLIVAIAESPERPLREVRLGTFWRQDGLRCVLYHAKGALGLRLYASDGSLLRQTAVGDLDDAEELATQWLRREVISIYSTKDRNAARSI